MRIVVARCIVDYQGKLSAHLPEARRLLMMKADGSVLVHADGGSYKPLNWMSPPCWLTEEPPVDQESGELTSEAMIWVVMVEPTLAPRMTPIDWERVIRPAEMKPTTITVVTEED